MTRLFFPTATDSVTCPRCGNSTTSDAGTCSHCGADLGSPALAREAGPSLAASLRATFASRRREALNAPYPSLPEASDISHGEQRWDVSKTVVAGGAVVALVVGGLIYMQHGESGASRVEPSAGQSASGTIDAKPLVSRSAARPREAMVAAAPSAAVTPAVSPAPQVAPSREAALSGGNVTDNLQATRDAIDRGDLTTARRRFSKIPIGQQDAGNVQRTQAELVSLERARDDSLRLARACEATGSWTCVRQNARDVLAIDASNVEAQTLVEHAIESSGWLNQPTHPAHATVPRAAVTAPGRPTAAVAAIAAPRATPSAAVPVTVPPRIATPTRSLIAAPRPHPATAPAPQDSATTGTSTTTPAPTITRAPLSTDGVPVATGSHAATPPTAESPDAAPAAVRQPPSAMPPLLTSTPAGPARAVPPQAAAASYQAIADTPRADTTSTSAPTPATATATATAPTPAPPIRAAAEDSPAPVLAPPAATQVPVTTHAPSFDAGNADDRERAIKEYGWKNQPATPPSPSQ
jgi:hypothetical protein